ncbi:MAG TPA: 50S ribosomal protein L37ae [Candidatus Nanoarchaeia archaeon]|nr:50S ribosomal protein L37ae [Candidatus Nanoarchaeia archaeon]
MAKKVEKLKRTKRFGARYGPRNKLKLENIEKMQHADHKCPYCLYKKIERRTLGIWHCRGCDATFASRAYTPAKTVIKEELEAEAR